MIGASSVLAWVMVIGFTGSIPWAIADIRTTPGPATWQVAGMVVNGLSYAAGLLLAYRALVIGRVSIVAPIVSTEGGLAALASVTLGESLGLPTALVLAALAVGIVLASMERSGEGGPGGADPALTRRTALLSIGAALAFSVGMTVSARLGPEVPISWIVLVSRGVGVVIIALPLLVRGRLRLSRQALPLVLVSGVLEALGSGLYVIGAHVSPAAAAVLSSQFAAITAVGAFILFGERLTRIQLVGVAIIAMGVTGLAVIRAA